MGGKLVPRYERKWVNIFHRENLLATVTIKLGSKVIRVGGGMNYHVMDASK